jgi:hypothetical protein
VQVGPAVQVRTEEGSEGLQFRSRESRLEGKAPLTHPGHPTSAQGETAANLSGLPDVSRPFLTRTTV